MRWSGRGRVTLTTLCDELSTGRSVRRIETDWPHRDRAIYILDTVDPHPEAGDDVEWSGGHLVWHRPDGTTVTLHKIGDAFDPYPQFSNAAQQI